MSDTSNNLPARAKSSQLANKMRKQDQKPADRGNLDTKGLTVTREEDLSLWYTEMLIKAQLISNYDVQDESPVYRPSYLAHVSSSCYILEPPIMFAWEQIRNFFDAKIQSIGVRNCYYRMLALVWQHLKLLPNHP